MHINQTLAQNKLTLHTEEQRNVLEWFPRRKTIVFFEPRAFWDGKFPGWLLYNAKSGNKNYLSPSSLINTKALAVTPSKHNSHPVSRLINTIRLMDGMVSRIDQLSSLQRRKWSNPGTHYGETANLNLWFSSDSPEKVQELCALATAADDGIAKVGACRQNSLLKPDGFFPFQWPQNWL